MEVQLPADLVRGGRLEAGESELEARSGEDLVGRGEHLRVPAGNIFIPDGDYRET